MVADEHRIPLTRYHLAMVNIAHRDLAAREAMVADEHRISLTCYHLAMVNIACRDLAATHEQQAMTAGGRETCITVKQEVVTARSYRPILARYRVPRGLLGSWGVKE